jgi:hypothetical protein
LEKICFILVIKPVGRAVYLDCPTKRFIALKDPSGHCEERSDVTIFWRLLRPDFIGARNDDFVVM